MYKVIGTTKSDGKKYYLSYLRNKDPDVGFSESVMDSYSFVNIADANLFIHRNKKQILGNLQGVKHLYAVDNNGSWTKICKLGKAKEGE